MKATLRKKRKENKRIDPFAPFKEATLNAFEFLISGYGFDHVSTTVNAPECEIKFSNETTGVSVTYEWQSAIWVDLIQLRSAPTEVIEDGKYSLDILMLERCPDEDINRFSGLDKEWNNEYINMILHDYAGILKKHGGDILVGDFRVFPRLRKLKEDVLLERNKELFGSETGETLQAR